MWHWSNYSITQQLKKAPPGIRPCAAGGVPLFKITQDRGIIEVNVGVEVRLDKPKTRISYADTRVFVGGVREI